ncbi:Hippocampus abundant transcript 1 protein [Homalodisca vitripennis]|nr:Hippocampus abundant transcript 1 protein [Homalodisca vitripennis]
MVTGMRGLCNGLGPAMFGIIFYLFHVDLNDDPTQSRDRGGDNGTMGHPDTMPQDNGSYARPVDDFLNVTYPGRWIGQLDPILWPSRSPNLNPLEFYCGCYLTEEL